ncbi:AbrB/MazE/SpoVT family DNA-binding domain-containing protein [Lachnoclostridium phytofermentans]|uniref:Transcriptional regulator, AbrB family n=1 Tax=Lachnoclostridium phytofermentans (strain ATCC 700394 / DSM 18823 / ISDg) TaxID=357809 RepID=A9KQ37_LACP7|nr:AbrB/MazE/SpoVT family DNA-binding domain-containing protein [Lachnoclostridium phytofermentans]ABX43349.1 transcriptional regulator, AbrB family [Lachnoclostridium phytofermentans ISDg]
MKNTGIVRHIDGLGRIVLPMEMRKLQDIKEGDPLEIYVDYDSIVLKKHQDECTCRVCGQKLGKEKRMVTLNDITLCTECIKWFNDEI